MNRGYYHVPYSRPTEWEVGRDGSGAGRSAPIRLHLPTALRLAAMPCRLTDSLPLASQPSCHGLIGRCSGSKTTLDEVQEVVTPRRPHVVSNEQERVQFGQCLDTATEQSSGVELAWWRSPAQISVRCEHGRALGSVQNRR